MERKVYITFCNGRAGIRMHLRWDCAIKGSNGEYKYISETEAREAYGAKEICKKCSKPKSVKGKTNAKVL